MKTPILAFLCALSTALLASGQVPSLINYQGRLTDANGAAVTGSKNFSINIFDAATGGNLLYSETIGAVTLDSNGVYSFQFGSAGTSNKQVTEAIGTTDGTTLVYSKALANSSVVNNSITVTDGTNSWSQSVGNPGAGATATANTIVGFVIGATITNGGSGYTSAPEVTISGNGTGASATATLTDGVVTGITIISAGSGYTTGATITIAPPVIPFRVEYASGTITATYASAPTAGRTIAATYRYGTGGIADALGNASEHWMAITVDGVTQGARQRVLAVPFAQRAGHAKSVDETGLYASTDSISSMLDEIALNGATSSLHRLVSVKDNQNALILNSLGIPWESGKGLLVNPPKISVLGSAGWESKLMATISNINSKVSKVKYTASTGSYEGHTEIVIFYQDGTNTGIGGQGGLYSNSYIEIINPNPDKTVSKIEYRGGNNRTGGGQLVFTDATFEFAGNDLSFSVSIAQPLIGSEFVVYLDQGLLTSNANVKASYTIRSGSSSFGPYSFGEKISLSTQQTIDGINVFFNGNFAAGSSPVTKVLLRKIR